MVERPLRVVYFGTPAFAVPTLRALLASPHHVVALVSQPDRPSGRGQRVGPTPTKQIALEAEVPILQPLKLRDEAFASTIASFNVDLGVVAAYGRILPDALLQIPRLGMINVHGSLLPKYRGAAPVHRAVMAGEEMTGITIMRVVA
ncbi:MAG: methionyl-tRNA formyltransferase, partial [Vicinamibacterales bacterium]